jgi:glutamine cyclotransferase
MALRGNSLWVVVATGTTTLFEYDVHTGEIVAVVDAGREGVGVTSTPRAVWVSDAAGHVARVDPRSHDVVAEIAVGEHLGPIAANGRSTWVAVLPR